MMGIPTIIVRILVNPHVQDGEFPSVGTVVVVMVTWGGRRKVIQGFPMHSPNLGFGFGLVVLSAHYNTTNDDDE